MMYTAVLQELLERLAGQMRAVVSHVDFKVAVTGVQGVDSLDNGC